ncbi:Alpha/Beta hydrolase protein [Radiomyces spectabilis]|uniref:Alpha/Beta hydrolase protein n=1 Tax=Radiomyces spectabilis TaxID=64574 RepID=UPI0022209662|nr:Alpha/Beta hydrolase protein [Radiomyces spectabilis]KAI8379731.1 Alpha/Beta hydrolase protein [Radiomyces spectabilis]
METRIENDHNETIVGILVEKETYPKKLVLIAHGEFGDKNSLYQPLLAEQLPYSTFRFDFRGHGDSHGQTGYANMAEDVQDLHTVADYFENRGYDIMAVIAHSRGSTAGLKYATTCDKPLSHYVNIAGRYIMNDYGIHMHSPEVQEALNRQTKQNGKTFVIKVTAADLEKIKQWDSSHVSRMPKSTCVLTCHGLKDT